MSTPADLIRYPVLHGTGQWHLPDADGRPLCGRPTGPREAILSAEDRAPAQAAGTVCRICIHNEKRSTR